MREMCFHHISKHRKVCLEKMAKPSFSNTILKTARGAWDKALPWYKLKYKTYPWCLADMSGDTCYNRLV